MEKLCLLLRKCTRWIRNAFIIPQNRIHPNTPLTPPCTPVEFPKIPSTAPPVEFPKIPSTEQLTELTQAEIECISNIRSNKTNYRIGLPKHRMNEELSEEEWKLEVFDDKNKKMRISSIVWFSRKIISLLKPYYSLDDQQTGEFLFTLSKELGLCIYDYIYITTFVQRYINNMTNIEPEKQVRLPGLVILYATYCSQTLLYDDPLHSGLWLRWSRHREYSMFVDGMLDFCDGIDYQFSVTKEEWNKLHEKFTKEIEKRILKI